MPLGPRPDPAPVIDKFVNNVVTSFLMGGYPSCRDMYSTIGLSSVGSTRCTYISAWLELF